MKVIKPSEDGPREISGMLKAASSFEALAMIQVSSSCVIHLPNTGVLQACFEKGSSFPKVYHAIEMLEYKIL